ncbi:hypothetical protein QCA50_005325 [Cerrena zonata]|uniref:FAD-binding PCMH-type domain-containing protein n=1 Tax=Cerrena zonata TaxID=2478898 RepID=A0AAW0GF23_9APHY
MEPISVKSSRPAPTITQVQFDELVSLVKGRVFRPTDHEFQERILTFNGQIKPFCQILVSALDAQDVSVIIRFCIKHDLSPSVKAGGYAIAGWSVAGDVVIDLSLMREIDIEPPVPTDDGHTWTSLRDMPRGSSTGKGVFGVIQAHTQSPTSQPTHIAAEDTTPVTTTKRRREDSPPPESGNSQRAQASLDDAHLRSYDAASTSVGSFLRGPPLPHVEGETPRQPPTNRPRLHSPEPRHNVPQIQDRQVSSESTTSATDSVASSSMDSSSATTGTSPSNTPVEGPSSGSNKTNSYSSNADPFGYIPGLASSSSSTSTRPPIYSGIEPTIPAIPPISASIMYPNIRSWPSPITVGAGPPGSSPIIRSPFGFTNPSVARQFTPGSSYTFPASRPIRTLSVANPIHSHAYVTIGAGMRQKEVDVYTSENALEGTNKLTGVREEKVVPYHIPSSAHPVGSSILLLAGFGFISRMHGLSVDNLVEVEMVLADGRIVILDKDNDPDLWWAIRGAGPAFGIATRYKVKAFPVPVVFAGNLLYRFHRATAPSLIKHFRDCIKGCPRELYANLFLTTGPANQDSLIVIQMCYVGPKEKGQEYLNAISSWDGDRPILNEVNEKSYLNQQDSVAQVLRGKRGRQWFMRSALIHSLPDEVINKTVMQFGDTPIGCTWIFELSGGAIGDFEDTCLPKEQREAVWTVAALHQWEMGIDDPRCITSAEEWMQGTIGMVSVGGPFPTFLGRHELPSRVMACYGKNWDRLAELKRKYDPTNVFRNNFWPLTETGEPVEFTYNEPPSP